MNFGTDLGKVLIPSVVGIGREDHPGFAFAELTGSNPNCFRLL